MHALNRWLWSGLAAALVASTLSGCNGEAAEASSPAVTAAKPAVAPPATAPAKPPAPPVQKPEAPAPKVVFESASVKLQPGKGEKDGSWMVATRLTNQGDTPIDGLELVFELKREGVELAERVHGTQVRFSPALAPGKSWPLTVLVPEPNKTVDAKGVTVNARAVKSLKPLAGPAWKPLDLASAKPVSAPVKTSTSKTKEKS